MSALYFAYGSNLNTAQMRTRCPSATVFSRARLAGFRPEYIQPHKGWGGGVLGLVPEATATAYGVVYRLSAAELQILDGHEPVASARYWRELHAVECEDAGERRAWVYFGKRFPDAPYPPAQRYLDTVLEGAREHALPEQYIAQLRGA